MPLYGSGGNHIQTCVRQSLALWCCAIIEPVGDSWGIFRADDLKSLNEDIFYSSNGEDILCAVENSTIDE